GSALMKQEALGFGDVKRAVFRGLLLGVPVIFSALFYGVLFAGIGALAFIVWHRSLKGNIAYGPYLAAGALLGLYFLPLPYALMAGELLPGENLILKLHQHWIFVAKSLL